MLNVDNFSFSETQLHLTTESVKLLGLHVTWVHEQHKDNRHIFIATNWYITSSLCILETAVYKRREQDFRYAALFFYSLPKQVHEPARSKYLWSKVVVLTALLSTGATIVNTVNEWKFLVAAVLSFHNWDSPEAPTS